MKYRTGLRKLCHLDINPIQTGGGGGGLEPAPTLKICNFRTVKAITTKIGDFS